jgi:hypothetical protein
MSESWPELESKAVTGGYPDWDVESVVEQIWSDLGGAVERPAIHREVAKVIPVFKDARITTYVPLFVRKRTVERLQDASSGAIRGPA